MGNANAKVGAKHSTRRSMKSSKAQDPKLEEEREEEEEEEGREEEEEKEDKARDKPDEQQEKREEQDVKQEDQDEMQEEEEVREEQSGERTEEPLQNHTTDMTEWEGMDETGDGANNDPLQVTTVPLVQPVPRAVEEFVGLNVGGVVYRTSRSTLVRHPDSLLGVIFTASVPTPKDDQGNYMIDGDGQMFRHILNYLRRGALCLPKNFQEHRLLEQEAAFYQLPELQDLVTEILKQTPSGGTSSQNPTGTMANTQVGIPTQTSSQIFAQILSQIPSRAEPTKEKNKFVIEVYVSEEDDRPQSWRIYGALSYLQNIPTLADYIHAYRKGSQCLEFTTQHPMFPTHTYRRFPKTTLFYHIFNLGFKLHTSDCIEITDENNDKTPWLRYLFIFTE